MCVVNSKSMWLLFVENILLKDSLNKLTQIQSP